METDFDSLVARCTDGERERVLLAGHAPDLQNLAGSEFDGVNCAPITALLGIKKFRKGFHLRGDQLWGYNVAIQQGDWRAPHEPKLKAGVPHRHGFYRVTQATSHPRYPHALLLDYGEGDNGVDPSRFLRDYLVQVRPDNPNLLLGKAYLHVMGLRIFGGFFVLKRCLPKL